ncbi:MULTISPECIES: GNAT family N-acetyltransferase [unclassified Vibrio]|uniref:GNAT family N-acetyltransferase n=1 Tax=unclassified Vibrio TaxID=2614977 RepID=UPI000C86122D|nr:MULTISPECIES: GNAT family N-acetyltransferase [unclassified Vibrio]PMI24692.1 GNAT family N-acetyltransferase [Vibrio sp. 10N.286.46.E10]PMI97646.1 GNAT family N-acetyltransferase [Vibrio sp. 10N.286.45.E10]PTO98652.1 GNAT family N-acetyltransferase [Vibrio sp. 10N.286.45.A3]PTQ22037.1 GNAT family N-acetyltransferase [Vibrio sp. 10N.286.46.E10]TKE75204.1 GNAT family N-acetyltransferase [Vibrio sp. F12]
MKIVEAKHSDLESLFVYLDTQLSEIALEETPLFQPVSKSDCKMSEAHKARFSDGFKFEFGENGWRKIWLAKDSNGAIRGHIDLRHHNGNYCSHRVLLGMGVDSSVRKQGLGSKLMNVATQYCRENEAIDWLDLNVLSNNLPAKNLYLRTGFTVVGEMEDYYRIDGQSVSELTMTLETKG